MRGAALANFAAVIAAVGALSASTTTAQQPQQAKHLQFEVAAIKPGTPRLGYDSWSSGGAPGGHFQMGDTPLKNWVEMGLSVRDYALVAPSWLNTSRFDLDARLPNEPLDQKAMAEMMKALLIERFGLKWHEELQTVSGYELVTDKKVLVQSSGLLERLQGHGGRSWGPTSISGKNMSMSEFAEILGEALGRPVVDATHLSGGHDIKLMWHPLDDDAVAEEKRYGKQYGIDVDNLPSSVTAALREQLGLRVQSAQIPLKVIVVDHVNRQPTGN